jgi:hypothetical protein
MSDTKLGGLKEALADFVASLNARLGTDGYLLNVTVLDGELDLSDLEVPTEGRDAREGAPNRDGAARESESPAAVVTEAAAAGVERTEPKGRRGPFRRRKRKANAGPGSDNGQGGAE